jgi:DNA topoisomerase I
VCFVSIFFLWSLWVKIDIVWELAIGRSEYTITNMKLLIIESPGKQKTIQNYLGADWRVVASLGHIRGLEQNLEFLTRDFEPRYEFLKEKGKAIKELKEQAKDADDIYLAADKDFEGEQIAYSVCLLLKLNPKNAKRVTFTEITEKAIRYAIEHPGTIDMNRVHTQQARAMLDLLIGFTMSPLLWRYVASSLSAGRCQTPAIRLVVEREDAIQNFKASSCWRMSCQWANQAFIFPAVMEEELEDEESATNYMENVHSTINGVIVLSNEVKPWSEKAPEPLITSTLQQQASAMFHSNPKATMRIAQRLYEAGHITYMRTDKAVLSEDATKEAKQWVEEHYGTEFVAQDSGEVKKSNQTWEKSGSRAEAEAKADGDSGPTKQEAHEAIRPTHMEVTDLPEGDWTAYDKKVYRLIWQRTIQSVMSPARGETCIVKTQIQDDEFLWSSSWKRTTFEGWKQAGKVMNLEEDSESGEESNEGAWGQAMTLKAGDILSWKSIKAEPKETKAQGRFTEATLVRELETYGIGRPSTFASLLAVIQEKGYVETKDIPAKEVQVKEYSLMPHKWPPVHKEFCKKVGAEKNKLVPTPLGRSVLDFMLQHFDDLFNYRFTSQMEKRLDRIAEGQEEWKQVLKDMWLSYQGRYQTLSSKPLEKRGGSSDKVREFGNGLKAVQSKKGPLLLVEGATKEDTQFLGWPDGIRFQDITEEQAKQFIALAQQKKKGEEIGEWNGTITIKKTGKFGTYLQCGETTIPYVQGEEWEKTVERLENKNKGGSNILKQGKDYVIRNGPYGPYLMKTSLKKPQFVSLPKHLDPTKLTEKDMDALYKSGLESKQKWKAKKM